MITFVILTMVTIILPLYNIKQVINHKIVHKKIIICLFALFLPFIFIVSVIKISYLFYEF